MVDEEKVTAGKVTLPKFNGKKDAYMTWWMRFMAYAAVIGFTQSIQDSKDPDLPGKENDTLSTNDDIRKKQEKALKSNRIAMANFTMAFSAEMLIGFCYKAITDDWPAGQHSWS